MADYPRQISDFCLILDSHTETPKTLVEAGRELQRHGYSVNTVAVGKLKKGLQIASRTGAAVAMFMFDGKVVFKKLGTGEQFELPAGATPSQTVEALFS
ncbi:MAG: hypothetical protein HC902_13320 [Calothrix sp. SM1_5_4]|nr:hypothetical protein [Calothrix sp. SM1_5_4]